MPGVGGLSSRLYGSFLTSLGTCKVLVQERSGIPLFSLVQQLTRKSITIEHLFDEETDPLIDRKDRKTPGEERVDGGHPNENPPIGRSYRRERAAD